MTCRSCGASVPDGARFCPSCGAAVHPLGDERRVVTVVFGDLVGFTALSERADPERVKNLVDNCFERLAEDVTAHGGRVDKIVGDAIVALFGAPTAHEDDAERAVRTALQMQRTVGGFAEEVGTDIRMRIGINSGEVLVGALRAGGDYTAMGDVVNVASRLQVEAGAGEVLVGPETHAATYRSIQYELRGPIRAKGREEMVDVWAAVEPLGLPGTRPGRTRTPLVGRKAELGMLWHALSTAAAHHRPHLLLLVGEAGVGKTRLVEEAIEIALTEHDALVLEGRCVPYGEANVWWPVAEALRHAFSIATSDDADVAVEKVRSACGDLIGSAGEGAEAARVADGLLYLMGYEGPLHDVDPTRARDEAMRAVQDALRAFAGRRPLVIVLSELHWADDLVLDLIDRSFERLRDLPAVLIATSRPEIEDRWTPRTGRHNLLVLNLDPLDRDGAAQLLRHLLGAEPPAEVIETIIERSGGNPLFLEELAALIGGEGEPVGELPATLRGLVSARLDALSASERAVLEDAAVVGRSGNRDALAALGRARDEGDLEAAFEALVVRDLLVTQDGSFAFKSDLVRDVAYETLTKGERARRHATLADWLAGNAERTDRVDEYLERIAHHYGVAAGLSTELGIVEGVDPEVRRRALVWLGRAARRAEERETWGVSGQLFEHALRLTSDPDDPERRMLLLGRARSRLAFRDMKSARADAREALRLAEGDGDASGAARALTVLGEIEVREGATEPAKEILVEAVRRWRELDDRPGEAEALRHWGMANLFGGDLRSAEDAISEALAASREVGDRRGEAWALQNLAWVSFSLGNHDEAEERLERAEQLFVELGDFGGQGWAVGLMGYVRYFKGDLPYAEAVAQLGIGWTEEMGDRWAHGMMVNLLASVRLWQGQTVEAAELAERASRLFEEIDDDIGRVQSLLPLAWAYALRARPDEASEVLGRAVAVKGGPATLGHVAQVTASNLAALTGDAESALDRLDLPAAADADADDPFYLAAHALPLLQMGRVDEAVADLELARDRETNAGQRAHVGSVLALAYAAAGRPPEAIDAADTVGSVDGSYLDRVRAALGRGFAFAQLERPFAARGAFDAALEIVDASEDLVNQAIVRLARAVALSRLGEADASDAVAAARTRLAEMGVVHRGWDTLFGLAAGGDVERVPASG